MKLRMLSWLSITLVLAMRLAPAVAAPSSTAQFHGGPAHEGVFAGGGPTGFFKLLWRFDAGHQVIASPIVADGVLYAGAKNGTFYAIDAASGALKWKFIADAPITGSSAVIQGLAILESDRNRLLNSLRQNDTGAPRSNSDLGIVSAVVFESNANTVYALDAKDGHVLWQRTTGADLPFDAMAGFNMSEQWDYWHSSPLVYKDRIYIGSGDGKIYALNARTGDVIWSFATEGRVRGTPATDGTRIYAGGMDGIMRALDIKSGKQIWSFKVLGNKIFPQGSIVSSATLGDGRVYFGSRDFNLYALDAKTGKEVWHHPVKGSWVPTTPAFQSGHLYVGSADGRVVAAYDAASGTQLWSNGLDNQLLFSSPVLADGKVYAATTGGTVFALNAQDGSIAGYTMTEDRVMSSPWIDNGVIYFGNNNGFIYAMTKGEERYPGG